MSNRFFPQPFKLTKSGIASLQSSRTTPVGKALQAAFLPSSVVIDTFLLPGSIAESIIRGEPVNLGR